VRIFLVDTWASLSGEACGVGATVLGNEIFLVGTWATSLSGEAGGVGATVLGNEWAMSGVQSWSSVAMVDPPPKTGLRFFE